MVNKVRTCVFISGDGTNLISLLKSSRDYKFPIKINLVISNNKDAKGLYEAKKYSIPFKIIPHKNKKRFERESLLIIKEKKINFICLAGFLKILSNDFIKKFGNKIVNIHPSLLPRFKGLNTHKRVLKNRERHSGCTVHFVSPDLDSGKIIMQKKILIKKNETESSLQKKILNLEHKIYPLAIVAIFK